HRVSDEPTDWDQIGDVRSRAGQMACEDKSSSESTVRAESPILMNEILELMTTDEYTEKMQKAFGLVTPERFGAKDWRCPIEAVLTNAELVQAGLTVEDIKEAIVFMTATEARHSVELARIGNLRLTIHSFLADGYRAGPAGP